MCQFWATTFPCGCYTWRNSGYEFCSHRGVEGGSCTITLRRYLWKTFCPRARKSLKGKRYTPDTRLPPCCEGKLDSETWGRLCHRCDSSPTEPSQGPTIWNCPGHLELLSDEVVDLETAEAVFEKAVGLWPLDHRGRYFRRKKDKACKGMSWSF
ncbi:hypothetical protein F4782DRAFT_449294 [Xylaria castorea]|nr:hypothetical protein F4782DRAFT_449294 [Xylaria castorea]